MVVTIGNQSRGPPFDSPGWPILDSRFIIFMFSSSGGMKFVILVEDSDSAYCFGENPRVRGGASHHPAFVGNCPNIRRTCYPYLHT